MDIFHDNSTACLSQPLLGTQSAHVIQRSVSSQALQHFACVDSTCFILEAYGTIRFQTSSGQRLERFGGKRSKDIWGLFISNGVRSTFGWNSDDCQRSALCTSHHINICCFDSENCLSIINSLWNMYNGNGLYMVYTTLSHNRFLHVGCILATFERWPWLFLLLGLRLKKQGLSATGHGRSTWLSFSQGLGAFYRFHVSCQTVQWWILL